MYADVQTLIQILKLKSNIYVSFGFWKVLNVCWCMKEVQCMLVLNALCILRSPNAMFCGFWFFDNVRGQTVLMLRVDAHFEAQVLCFCGFWFLKAWKFVGGRLTSTFATIKSKEGYQHIKLLKQNNYCSSQPSLIRCVTAYVGNGFEQRHVITWLLWLPLNANSH